LLTPLQGAAMAIFFSVFIVTFLFLIRGEIYENYQDYLVHKRKLKLLAIIEQTNNSEPNFEDFKKRCSFIESASSRLIT
jgi:hypothetical protein